MPFLGEIWQFARNFLGHGNSGSGSKNADDDGGDRAARNAPASSRRGKRIVANKRFFVYGPLTRAPCAWRRGLATGSRDDTLTWIGHGAARRAMLDLGRESHLALQVAYR